MKHTLLLLVLGVTLYSISSCKKEDTSDKSVYEYHAHIHSPNTDAKHMNDTIDIDIEFESHTGEPVHNIRIDIVKKSDNTVIYSTPSNGHLHGNSGSYEFSEQLVLSAGNGFTEHTDYIMEAHVWGATAGEEEVVETVEFHVHP